MLRKILPVAAILLLALAAYLCFAPIPAKPQVWQAKKSLGYVGAHVPNQKLAQLKQISLNGEIGPEHVAFGPDGALYASVDGGKIVRMQADGGAPSIWANTGGRVLGFAFDSKGQMIAADAFRGLLAISMGSERKITVLLDKIQVAGKSEEIKFANSVVIAKNVKIYFSDSSTQFGTRAWGGTFLASVMDILEHSSTGRVIEFDPSNQQARIVIQDLCFANGLALSDDEKSLFVAETGEYRVWKIDPAAQNLSAKISKGNHPQAKVLLDNLPGYPDNLMRGLDGKIWLGLAKPRSNLVDQIADKPFLREVTLRLPQKLWPVPPNYGHVIAFNENGKILADLQDPKGSYPETTGVVETADKLIIQSLHAHSLGWMERPKF